MSTQSDTKPATPAPEPGSSPVDNTEPVAKALVGRVEAGVVGLLAAALALGTGEMLAGLSTRTPSLIRAIGDVFVDKTPGSLVRASIDSLGSSQKPALLWGIGIAAIVIGGLLGLASRRSNTPALIGFGIFGLVGGLAASDVPLTSSGLGWFSALLATTIGIFAFGLLMGLARASASADAAAIADAQADAFLDGASPAADTPAFVAGTDGISTTPSVEIAAAANGQRRAFLGFAGAASALGVFGIGFGRWLGGRQNVEAARQELATRISEETVIVESAPPLTTFTDLDSEVPGISSLITPNNEFYRIDTALQVPQLDPTDWYMEITGMVDTPVRFTLDDLLALPQMESDVTLSCVSNEVGGNLVGNARWTGVRLSDLLDMAGVQPGATQIASESWDGWDCGFPTEIAFDGRDAMVALTMNGEPLPIIHGFPARLVIPGLYGYVSATKWLKEVRLTTLEDFDGYWIPRGWGKYGPIKTQSRIDVPRSGETVSAGVNAIAGVAWAGIRSISRVEVRVDEGDWLEAQLGEELSESTWRQWVLAFDLAPGDTSCRSAPPTATP